MSVSEGRPIHVRLAGRSHVGLTRTENQDLFFAGSFPGGESPEGRTPVAIGPGAAATADGSDPAFVLGVRGALAAVADGMGGPGGGSEASRLALSAVVESLEARWVLAAPPPTPGAFAQALEESVAEANRRVHGRAQDTPRFFGMGTTLTLAGVLEDTLYLVQVGDSRAYLLRGGRLTQLTRDQSLVQDMVDRGILTPEAAARSTQRNVILQAIGPEPALSLFTEFLPLRRGDLLLLCSDGLSGFATHDRITEILLGGGSLGMRGDRLVEAALEGGGGDNVTALLVEFLGEGLRPGDGAPAPLPRRVPQDAR